MTDLLKKKSMVGWYDPRQLINTGIQALISDLIGVRFDARREESLAAEKETQRRPYTPEVSGGDFWFDYMADSGDGWDSTYSMAKLVSESSINLAGETLPRGKFLILGGDEIYPFASRDEYKARLVAPFEEASPPLDEHKVPPWDLFAIPGNHDWYDGLISFQRQFVQQRRIGSWQTRQQRSYFSLQLPYGWWLWGIDTQLENDLDLPQLKYFSAAAERMEEGDRVIVCIAEPDWLYGKMLNDLTLMNNLHFLFEKILKWRKVTMHLTLAGDLHHYRRHEHASDPNKQKIVSGGGGAFLHPTHAHKLDEVTVYDDVFKLKKETQFPKESTSFWLTFKNLLFPFFNPWFGILTGVLYVLIGWRVIDVQWSFGSLFALYTESTLRLVLILALYFGFIRFADRKGPFKFFWGALHATAHVFTAFWIANQASQFCNVAKAEDLTNWKIALCRLPILYLGGHLLGSFIMGLYLLLSLNLWHCHHNEAFMGLRIKDYKNFLRMRIKPDGTLQIFPIGLTRLDKPPVLIEGPITITPLAKAPGDDEMLRTGATIYAPDGLEATKP